MDLDATLPQPLEQVFARLAAPLQLGDWLPEVRRVEATPALLLGLGAVFTLTLRTDGRECVVSGEMIAYEPPWLAAFRLLAGERTHLLRLTCSACADGTRVQIHQADAESPLRVDLDRLARALAMDGREV